MMKLIPAAIALLFLGACGHVVPATLTADEKAFDFKQNHPCREPERDDSKVEVRYLGSGGVWIAWRGEAILLGPSFSNPPLWRAAVWRIRFDDRRIEEALKPIEVRGVPVRAILAGHSHYDHIGDLPRIAAREAFKDARIHVNASGMKMLHAAPELLDRAHEIDPAEVIEISEGIHVRAVRSGHAPQLCPLRMWPCIYAGGHVENEWRPPWTRHLLQSFRGGDAYAFEIELRENGRTRYRIYYNDASADAPAGQNVHGETFDLAILCMAQWNWVRDYPRALLEVLKPRHVVVSHWDDFFGRREVGARFVRNLSNAGAERFLNVIEAEATGGAEPSNEVCGARAKSRKWTMPVIGASMQFTPQ